MTQQTLYTVTVYSENQVGLLNQISIIFTRRQLNIESLSVSGSAIEGVHKFTITTYSDRETMEKLVKQIEKRIDVLRAFFFIPTTKSFFSRGRTLQGSYRQTIGRQEHRRFDSQTQCPHFGSKPHIYRHREIGPPRRNSISVRRTESIRCHAIRPVGTCRHNQIDRRARKHIPTRTTIPTKPTMKEKKKNNPNDKQNRSTPKLIP